MDAVANRAYEHVAEEIARRHRDAARQVFDRARERGDDIDETTVDPVVECLYGAVTMKVLTHGFEEPFATDAGIEASCMSTVDLVMRLLER